MEQAEIVVPDVPAAPADSICEVCGEHAHWEPVAIDNWFMRSVLSRAKELGWKPFYKIVGHEPCQLELKKRDAEAAALRELEEFKNRRREVADHWINKANLPADLRERTLDAFEVSTKTAETVQTIAAWNESDPFGFLLYGPSGSGKSHLAFAIINRVIDTFIEGVEGEKLSEPKFHFSQSETGQSTRWYGMPVYFSAADLIQSARSKDAFGEVPKFALAKELLVIDDIGAENITDWTRDLYFRIFEYRLNHKLQTVVTTNLGLNELKERMGERVSSRLLAMCVPLLVEDRDRRRDSLAENFKTLKARIKSSPAD
jgi:DNA replication protein DnaC